MYESLPLTVPGDGSAGRVTQTDLAVIMSELDTVKNETGQQLLSRSRDGVAARLCLWKGQSADGRKHAAKGSDAFPYEGAPDNRVRLIDFLINYYTGVYTAAMRGANRAVAPMELTDSGFSSRMQTLMDWILENLLGDTLPAEMEMLLNWMEGDTPAVSIAGIYWQTDTTLETRTLTVDDMVEALLPAAIETLAGQDPAFAAAMQAQDPTAAAAAQSTAREMVIMSLTAPGREQEGVNLIRSVVPEVNEDKARRMLKELATNQSATYTSPVNRFSGPRVCAHRLYDDIFIPGYTQGIQRAPAIFIREMLTEVELRERILTQGYSKAFVEKLIGDKKNASASRGFQGESFLNEAYTTANSTLLQQQDVGLYEGSELPWRGHYEVVTGWYRAVNALGVAGIYYVAFSHCAQMAAHDRRLSTYAHGKYPFVAFTRERITRRLIDARSTADLALTDQLTQKKLLDTAVIHAEIGAMPPIEKDWSLQKVLLGPFAENNVKRMGDIRPIALPSMPTSMDKVWGVLDRRVAMYFGIPHPEVPPELTQAVLQKKIDNVLVCWREVLVMVLQLAQQYMTPEMLKAVTGAQSDLSIAESPEAIRGRFNIKISFDARTLSLDWLKELMAFAKEIVALDPQGVILRDKLVAIIARAYGANLADSIVQPAVMADLKTDRETDNEIAGAFGGIMPPMPEKGVNFRRKLDRFTEWQTKNPVAHARAMAIPDTKQILTQYDEYLQQGVNQEQNAVIGRIGTRPDLDLEAMARDFDGAPGVPSQEAIE